MKKIVILLSLLVLCACSSKEKADMKTYNKLVEELRNVSESTDPIDIDIDVEVEKIDENTKNYRVLIGKSDYEMKDITALIITNEENVLFPSIGIFDEKVTLNKDSKEKGVKLSGYFSGDDITFRVYVSFTKGKEVKKYYYIVDKVTYFE